MTKKITLLICIVFLASACSVYRINSEEVTSNFYYPKKAADVEIIDSVSQPHEVVGYITVNTERNQSMQDVLDKMKVEAAKLGGDAVTNIQSNATGSWKKIPAQNFVGNAYVRANFSGTVIAFK